VADYENPPVGRREDEMRSRLTAASVLALLLPVILSQGWETLGEAREHEDPPGRRVGPPLLLVSATRSHARRETLGRAAHLAGVSRVAQRRLMADGCMVDAGSVS
jgi:hypothetical protein